MRRFLLIVGLICLPVVPVAQISLPQVENDGGLRPLVTMDAVRGYEAVGRLDTAGGYCSATLIAPELIVTAAHCLFDPDGRRIDDALFVYRAGLRNGRAEAERRIASSYIPERYRYTGPSPDVAGVAADLALLELDSPIALARVQPIRTGTATSARDLVTVVSYGEDRDAFASIEEDCRVLALEDGVSALSCSAVPGSSGAPVLRRTPSGLEIAAVVSAMGRMEDRAAAFAVDAEPLLRDLLADRAAARGDAGGMAGTVRRLGVGDGGRGEIGARFLRP